jgi:membrane protein YdbS with pleckstrin-like domain
MRFIRKKNLLETEELLYKPQLHWMFTIRHMVLSVPFFLLLLAFWVALRRENGFFGWPGEYVSAVIMQCMFSAVKHVFFAAVILVFLVFVWRIFQYLSTEFGVTNKRLIIRKGIIRVVIAEIPFDRIESIYCLRGIMGRIFNYGTICVSGVGGMMPVFYMVNRPFALRRKIADIIEKNKAVTVVHGDMPRPKPLPEPEPQSGEPIFRYGTFVRVLPENPGRK